jgi:glycosyltransferase involved in cell wall biosynthesis
MSSVVGSQIETECVIDKMKKRRIFANCVVKDEDDIIAETLLYATRYCDKVYVLDNGSTDDTWKITQALAKEHPQIVPFAQTYEPYRGSMRAIVYNKLHHELSDDDWWLYLDADEFLAEDPQPVIESAVRGGADVIFAWQIQFYFTEKDEVEWRNGLDNRQRSIFERRRYYLINWQEPRLIRNQTEVAWDERTAGGWPNGLRKVSKRRILNRHYQYRDPDQIQKRLDLRFGQESFRGHVESNDWRTVVRPSAGLNYRSEGEPWRFKVSGVLYYYRTELKHKIRGKLQGALRRLHKSVGR